jgi:hypothetical protein
MKGSRTNVLPTYNRVMESAGYYYKGSPADGVIEATMLRNSPGTQIDKSIRYKPIIDPGQLNADAIYELTGSACIYFTSLADAAPSQAELARLHSIAWNHGLAPLLWVTTPTQVLLFNCYSKPKDGREDSPQKHLIRVFEQTDKDLQRLNEFAGRLKIQSGEFWLQEEAQKIDRNQRVDRALLNDLRHAEGELSKQGLDASVGHALLGRSIFVAYLQDRGILKPEQLKQRFGADTVADVLGSHEQTYKMFEWIRTTFNGSLFPLEHQINKTGEAARHVPERDIVGERHLESVRRLMLGTKMSTGQMRLWPYKFDVIPVELISSIYEMFAHTIDEEAAKKRSTHYTPFNLVDLVLSQVFKGLPGTAKVLDPACGSGAFLVEALRRLVARRITGGEALSRRLVRHTLYNQIYGIDVSPEAAQIAAFSLYLTALELDPAPEPLEELKFEPLIGRNLFTSNAFDEEAPYNKIRPFAKKNFGAIVGNPPWTADNSDNSAVSYCEKHNHPLYRGHPDQAFMWRIGDFANDNTRIGLIVNARPFFSQVSKAREVKQQLLTSFTPRVLINLSSLRQEKLFPTSTAPAMIVIAEGKPVDSDDSLALVTVEKSDTFKRHGIIEIGPENVKRLPVKQVACDPDLLKTASWGSARDTALIRRLRADFSTLKMMVEQNNTSGWHAGQGFMPGPTNETESVSRARIPRKTTKVPDLYGKKWLQARKMTPYEVNAGTLPNLTIKKFRYNTDDRNFIGPLVIISRNLRDGWSYAAFSEEDVVYESLYYGISIPEEQVDMAHYLNAIFNSSLANYFLFLSASSWGVERDELLPVDILRLPVPKPDADNSQIVKQIIRIEARLRQASDEKKRSALLQELDGAIFDLYKLDDVERILVADMIEYTIRPRGGKTSLDQDRPSLNGMRAYASELVGVIGAFMETLGERCMVADVLDTGESLLQVVKFSIVPTPVHRPIVQVTQAHGLRPLLESIARKLPQQIAQRVTARRFLRIYVDNDVYVVKPYQGRYWSKSAGLNDADAVLGAYLESSRGSTD